MRHCALALFCLGLFASCRKDHGNPADPEQALYGSWNWVMQYDDGFYSGDSTSNPANDVRTPANTGIVEVLDFRKDGQWSLTQNGHAVDGGPFKFSDLISPEGPIKFLDMTFKNGTDSFMNHEIFHDTLYIATSEVIGVHKAKLYVRSTATTSGN